MFILLGGLSFSFSEDTKQLPVIPGLSTAVGTMIYAGSIGTQIANELIDSYRCVVICTGKKFSRLHSKQKYIDTITKTRFNLNLL